MATAKKTAKHEQTSAPADKNVEIKGEHVKMIHDTHNGGNPAEVHHASVQTMKDLGWKVHKE